MSSQSPIEEQNVMECQTTFCWSGAFADLEAVSLLAGSSDTQNEEMKLLPLPIYNVECPSDESFSVWRREAMRLNNLYRLRRSSVQLEPPFFQMADDEE